MWPFVTVAKLAETPPLPGRYFSTRKRRQSTRSHRGIIQRGSVHPRKGEGLFAGRPQASREASLGHCHGNGDLKEEQGQRTLGGSGRKGQ